MSDEEVGVSRCPAAARPMFRCLFPLPPTLVRAPRERLAQATDIKNQNAYPCAASTPIVDAGVTETMFSGDATVTGSLAAANPALRVGRRKAFWNASVPQEVQPFELTATETNGLPAQNLDQAKCMQVRITGIPWVRFSEGGCLGTWTEPPLRPARKRRKPARPDADHAGCARIRRIDSSYFPRLIPPERLEMVI